MGSLAVFALTIGLFATEPNEATRRWWKHVVALSGDDLQGRDTGSEGYVKAARYVVTQFERAGLRAAGENGYYQSVPLHEIRLIPDGSKAELLRADGVTPLQWLHQFTMRMQEGMPDHIEAKLVFAGGGEAPAGWDARGRLVVSLNGFGPRRAPADAAGTISIDNPHALEPPRWPLQYAVAMRLAATAAARPGGLSLRFNPADAELLFQGSGHTYKELAELASQGKPLPWFELPATFRATVKSRSADLNSDNVLAVLPGSDAALAKEYVVVSAHLDGYGLGEAWGTDNIYNGAFDDAAYVATLIDLAEKLHDAHTRLRRSILFCVVTAEEKGLFGSKYFAEHPTVPKEQMVADINLDQLRPIFPLHTLTTLALDQSTLGDTVKEVAASMSIRIQPDPEPGRNLLRRSDHWNFMQIGVPAVGFIFGYEKGSPDEAAYREWYAKRYHSPLDDLNQPWIPEAAAKFNDFFDKLVAAVANAEARPRWTGAKP
jgi:Zn-dependent M28 family amino/carboxypeptidase